MNYTANYQLPQWVESDRLMMDDFNDMTAKVDQGLSAAAWGNCHLTAGSYVGTGTYGKANPNRLEFDFSPQLIFLGTNLTESYNSIPEYYILFRAAEGFQALGDTGKNLLTWEDKAVSWYFNTASTSDSSGGKKQFNQNQTVYHYLAVG